MGERAAGRLKEEQMLEGVILAGGRGERFWPLSTHARPKQLLRLLGEETLVQTTWARLGVRLDPGAIWVSGGSDLREAIRGELPELQDDRFISEPVGRNTAPAVAVAAALGMRGGRDPLQLVVPSDHWIPSTKAFWASVEIAMIAASAEDSPLVTFGIPISRPETGYGYIERGARRSEAAEAFAVRHFDEKPDVETARAYQAAGDVYWNSGIFLWRAGAILEEVERHMPALWKQVRRLIDAPDPGRLLPEIFERAPTESVDVGILERSDRVVVIAADFQWSDVGNWSSWGELGEADAQRNVHQGEVVALDSEDCVLFSESGLIATLGVRNLVVVRAGDVTLIADRNRCQDVRAVLKALKETDTAARYL
jgi:mannose-1-phosphate guanylyltransferase/mannose-6-phosphate isomerase